MDSTKMYLRYEGDGSNQSKKALLNGKLAIEFNERDASVVLPTGYEIRGKLLLTTHTVNNQAHNDKWTCHNETLCIEVNDEKYGLLRIPLASGEVNVFDLPVIVIPDFKIRCVYMEDQDTTDEFKCDEVYNVIDGSIKLRDCRTWSHEKYNSVAEINAAMTKDRFEIRLMNII